MHAILLDISQNGVRAQNSVSHDVANIKCKHKLIWTFSGNMESEGVGV